jgi:hypothetical protein
LRGIILLAAVLVAGGAGCGRTLQPLRGELTTRPLPRTVASTGPERVVVDWRYSDIDFAVRGEGLVRVSPPDSARLDFFLNGGYGGGKAYLIGDSLAAPGAGQLDRVLPPPELLWAALGRLAVQGADTTIRVDGDTLRAEIGTAPRWRAAFVDEHLVRLERIEEDRVTEFVVRQDTSTVRYERTAPRRRLDIAIVGREPTRGFDADIWR